ncbi:methyl-accepting chemotaxis protein [Anaerobacterium chartisolvens]|nr:methyl-accepting chemotaxis protein [Anaerobacterium chartisolvens]
MKWFYDLKIAVKLLTGFIAVALLAGAVGVFGIIRLKDIDQSSTAMYEQNTKPLGNLAIAASVFQRVRLNVRNIVIDTGNIRQYSDKIEEFNTQIYKQLEEYKLGISSSEEREDLDTLLVLLEELKPLRERVISLASSGQTENAKNFMLTQTDPVSQKIDEQINKLLTYNIEMGDSISKNNTLQANAAVVIMIVIVIAAVIISFVLGLFISRIISKPVNQMVYAADKLAVGDVNVNVEADFKDEIGSLAESFARMIASIREQAMTAERIASGDLTAEVNVRSENDLLGKKLSEMVEKNNEILSNIASASEQVAAGSKQVSDSSIALSQGATEQASSIEELTASLEEISSQTKLNAQNANQANELAEAAKSNAAQGNTRMNEMLKAMEEINDSSANISKIIKVIDEIAFQTNILALNAAVEAARAGQHGKGFAVVAEEVRNLAARSANAAKETTDMIESSIKKVEGGTKIARDTADALNKIVGDVARVSELVNDIAVASGEQATGIAQINQGVMQVSQVVQTNSATSEESAAASEELSSQAELLRESVSRFKLKKVVHTYGKFEEINPEILKMLEDMADKKKAGKVKNEEEEDEEYSLKPKIELGDRGFGKY